MNNYLIKNKIETKRLYLRPLKIEDLNDFYDFAKVEGVGESAGWLHHKDIEYSKKILIKMINSKQDYAIVYKENNKVIGELGIFDKYENDKLMIGFVLNKNYWNKGLATEIVKELIDYIFTNTDYQQIYMGHFESNLASKRVVEKCGFKFYKKYNSPPNAFEIGNVILVDYILEKPKDYENKKKENPSQFEWLK